MKLLIKLSVLSALLVSLFGCASTDGGFETRLAPPEDFNPTFLEYKKLPGEKVMVIAVDPGEHWAFGYDHSRASLQEAAENAAFKCDEARKKHQVYTKAKIFAVNNDIVYYDQFNK
jgi:hypothetical protein